MATDTGPEQTPEVIRPELPRRPSVPESAATADDRPSRPQPDAAPEDEKRIERFRER